MSKTLLIILDGRGIANNQKISAISPETTPYYFSLLQKYPHTQLEASELAVGLPVGQVGNSEVGHTTLGAGRVLYQDIVKINRAIESEEFFAHPDLKQACEYAQTHKKQIHIMGLCSDGGVHSHIDHLQALAQAVDRLGSQSVFHLFTDGRDTKPDSGIGFVHQLENFLKTTSSHIGSLIGRYYAMDRDQRRERVKQARELLTQPGVSFPITENVQQSIQTQYDAGTTDEFLNGIRTSDFAPIAQGDVVIFANFRSDRGRELTIALTQKDLADHGMHTIPDLHYYTMTRYDEQFENVHVLYDKDNVAESLGELISQAGKTQTRIAETEKYPHVTFFFSGGREEPFVGESRILIPSPKVATYDLQPSMGSREIADAIVPILEKSESDFICLNFAAPDMVGHTGVREAAVEACRIVDESLHKVIDAALIGGYTSIVLADHGNADQMIQEDGSPHTAHTLAKVPCILVSPSGTDTINFREGAKSLADIAPTILQLMGITQPSAMGGKSVIV